VHLDDATVAMLFATIGAYRIALVTDAVAAAGLGDGTYTLGPRTVEVSDGIARVASGALAGGTATLAEVLRRVVAAGVSVVEATRAATSTPARAVGLDGEVGARARPGGGPPGGGRRAPGGAAPPPLCPRCRPGPRRGDAAGRVGQREYASRTTVTSSSMISVSS
jgi:hypothetical protein